MGALAALVMMLRIPPSDADALVRDVMRTFSMCADVPLFVQSYGLDDGSALRDIIRRVLHIGGLSPDITLEGMHRMTRREYTVVVTNLHTQAPVYLHHGVAPELRVADALYMSMCIPFVFVPMLHAGEYHVDGCLSVGLPRCFDDASTLFFDVCVERTRLHIDSVATYAQAVFGFATPDWNGTSQKTKNENTLWLHAPPETASTPIFNFDMDDHLYRLYFRAGYASVLAFLYPSVNQTICGVLRTLLMDAFANPRE